MNNSCIHYRYTVPDDDFTQAGAASSDIKKKLKMMALSSDVIRKVAIAMYEGEINMVIHAGGGVAVVDIYYDKVNIVLSDKGGGIEDLEKAMQPGFSTAPEAVQRLGFGAGMGLPNMKKYADKFDIQSEVGVGTTVRMTIFFG